MDVNEKFRANLERLMIERGMNPAQLSIAAGLNRRMVTDILDERAQSPKLSTIARLSVALGCDIGDLIGLGGRARLAPKLAEILARYDPAEQEQLAEALARLPRAAG